MADAFSKFKASVNRGITTISVKTSSSLEKSKIKTHVDTLENDIQHLMLEIGKTSYGKWKNNDPDCTVLEQLFKDVQQKEDEIEKLKEEMAAIDVRDSEILGVKEEPKQDFPAQEEQPQDGQKQVCPACGAVYDTHVNFCRKCGHKMDE